MKKAAQGVAASFRLGCRLRSTREVLGVEAGELLPLVGELVLGEAGVDRAGLDAGVAVDALVRIDEELLDVSSSGLVRQGWMQSTGQTSTQELSFWPMHGSAIT